MSNAASSWPRAELSVPMIPGLVSDARNFIHRPHFRKGQLLEQMSKGQMRAEWPPPAPTLNVEAPRSTEPPRTSKSNQTQTGEPLPMSTKCRQDASQPKWITHDRQVLRFFGYFLEPIVHETHEKQTQTHRVRRLVLLFYLSDHSVSISEPRVANSGMPQGEFMKRTVVMTPQGVLFEPQDFRVGGHIKLYGRTIHLVDCDAATRTYYEEALEQSQETARKYPDDTSSKMDEVEELKRRLRQKAAAASESNAEKRRKFHEHGQHVLRFFVSWQDPHPLYPETRQYVLHYYLSDDTMEIVEPKHEREGRGHFAVLLSRRRMTSDDKKDRFITERDLRCGDFVHVFARRFLLEDCDAFTRDYYLETHGVTQEKYEPQQSRPAGRAAKWKLFQVNPKEIQSQMQGHDVDHLDLRAADDKDRQFYQNDALEKKQLRFRARFHGLHRIDPQAQREFVLTFFLEDDTLAVFEPRVKNSGVSGGRFLDRGRFRKCCEPEAGGTLSREKEKQASAYRANDFFVGAVIGFEFAPHQRLELIEADRQTLLYCESHPARFPFSDGTAVVKELTRQLQAKGRTGSLRRECRSLDRSGRGVLAPSDVKTLLHRLGVAQTLNAQQVVTLCRRFEDAEPTEEQRGFVCADFCDAVALALTGGDPRSKDAFGRLRQCAGLRRLLRETDTRHQGEVTTEELKTVAAAYKVALSSMDLQEITRRCGQDRGGRVNYDALCDLVFALPGEEAPLKRNDRAQDCQNDDDEETMPLYSLRRGRHADHDDGAFDDCYGNDDGDACVPHEPSQSSRVRSQEFQSRQEPPESPRRVTKPSVPPLPLNRVTADSALQRTGALAAPRDLSSDTRVVALLQRVFGDRKYQLRKALRERDRDKTGFLGEEGFMDAVLAVEPRLSDDDSYLIADVYFPTNNCQIDYTQLLESAFRSSI